MRGSLAKTRYSKAGSLSQDTQRFYDVLNDEPEFVQIVVGTAYLDAWLGGMLERFFAETTLSDELLDARGGPMGSFAARARLCYCLGLLGKLLYQDLAKIAEIRNIVAHHYLTLDFSHPEVERMCIDLKYIDSPVGPGGPPVFASESPRDRFVLTVALGSERIILDGLGLQHRTVRP